MPGKPIAYGFTDKISALWSPPQQRESLNKPVWFLFMTLAKIEDLITNIESGRMYFLLYKFNIHAMILKYFNKWEGEKVMKNGQYFKN